MSHITAACWIALASSHSFEESEPEHLSPELSNEASCISEADDDDDSSRIYDDEGFEHELPKDLSDMISIVCFWGVHRKSSQ